MTEQSFESMRQAMVVSQLRTTGVNDPRVLAAMAEVPRERFVPAEQAAVAYRDRPLPLGGARALPPPMVLGRLLTEARPRPQDRALVIGAGAGYAAAVLAALVAHVTALEEDAALAAGPALPDSVERVAGPLVAGWAAGAPYDLILFDGAVPEVPPAIVAQLADGGRIAAPIVEGGVVRLALGHRAGESFGLVAFLEAGAPTLPGFERPAGFRF